MPEGCRCPQSLPREGLPPGSRTCQGSCHRPQGAVPSLSPPAEAPTGQGFPLPTSGIWRTFWMRFHSALSPRAGSGARWELQPWHSHALEPHPLPTRALLKCPRCWRQLWDPGRGHSRSCREHRGPGHLSELFDVDVAQLHPASPALCPAPHNPRVFSSAVAVLDARSCSGARMRGWNVAPGRSPCGDPGQATSVREELSSGSDVLLRRHSPREPLPARSWARARRAQSQTKFPQPTEVSSRGTISSEPPGGFPSPTSRSCCSEDRAELCCPPGSSEQGGEGRACTNLPAAPTWRLLTEGWGRSGGGPGAGLAAGCCFSSSPWCLQTGLSALCPKSKAEHQLPCQQQTATVHLKG